MSVSGNETWQSAASPDGWRDPIKGTISNFRTGSSLLDNVS